MRFLLCPVGKYPPGWARRNFAFQYCFCQRLCGNRGGSRRDNVVLDDFRAGSLVCRRGQVESTAHVVEVEQLPTFPEVSDHCFHFDHSFSILLEQLDVSVNSDGPVSRGGYTRIIISPVRGAARRKPVEIAVIVELQL